MELATQVQILGEAVCISGSDVNKIKKNFSDNTHDQLWITLQSIPSIAQC